MMRQSVDLVLWSRAPGAGAGMDRQRDRDAACVTAGGWRGPVLAHNVERLLRGRS